MSTRPPSLVRTAFVVMALAACAGTPGAALADTPPQPATTVKAPTPAPVPKPDAAPVPPAPTPVPAQPAPAFVPAPAPRANQTPTQRPKVKARHRLHVAKPKHAKPKHRVKPATIPKPAPAKPAVVPNIAAPAARHRGITPTTIGVLAGGALLLLLILALVVRATRRALARPDAALPDPIRVPAATPAETLAAAIPVLAAEQRGAEARMNEPSVPAAANGSAPPAADETIAITLWRGYTKARFMARSGQTGADSVIATSEPFRWREHQTHQPEAAIRAHAKLLAKLAESGWRPHERADGEQWYDVTLRRSAGQPALPRAEEPGDVPAPLPATR